MGYYNNYLAHHGILGQKWGKKSGPPYPLGASDHTAAEKKAASAAGVTVGSSSGKGSIENVNDSQNNVSKKNREPLTKEEKEAMIRKGDAAKIQKRAEEFSNDELRRALERIDLSSRLDSYVVKDSTYKRMETTMKKVETMSRWGKEAANTWNFIASVNNSLNPKFDLPVIRNVAKKKG